MQKERKDRKRQKVQKKRIKRNRSSRSFAAYITTSYLLCTSTKESSENISLIIKITNHKCFFYCMQKVHSQPYTVDTYFSVAKEIHLAISISSIISLTIPSLWILSNFSTFEHIVVSLQLSYAKTKFHDFFQLLVHQLQKKIQFQLYFKL